MEGGTNENAWSINTGTTGWSNDISAASVENLIEVGSM